MRILVTGAAGFIGAALTRALLSRGDEVVGVDNLSPYYDVELKRARLRLFEGQRNFRFLPLDIASREEVPRLFAENRFQRVVHLAAQPGMRYSLTNPHAYIDANLIGFMNVLEGCRHSGAEHLVYASSSSVYGANRKLPFSVEDGVDHPISIYAATKKANELMAHSYSHLYRLPTTGLRFFTVYGPWGRPDMAPFLFARNILTGEPIELFNYGKHRRDFTYIDDIVEGVVRVLDRPAQPDPAWSAEKPASSTSNAPYRVYNIGNSEPIWLDEFLSALETALGRKADKRLVPQQAGDVLDTYADVDALARDFDFRPRTSIQAGVKQFAEWYLRYYQRGA